MNIYILKSNWEKVYNIIIYINTIVDIKYHYLIIYPAGGNHQHVNITVKKFYQMSKLDKLWISINK